MNLTFRLPDGKMSVRDRGFMVVKEMEDEVRIEKLVVVMVVVVVVVVMVAVV